MKSFFDRKDEKITEKAFTQGLSLSVVSILLCLVALCSMTYAWFTSETTSSRNTFTSGSFDITVNISKTESELSTASETVVFEDGKYRLTEEGIYTVTLTATDTTTVKGYCVVTVNGTLVYRTGVIVNERALNEEYQTETNPFAFAIETNHPDTVVEIEAYWGVPAGPTVNTGEPIKVGTAQSGAENDEFSHTYHGNWLVADTDAIVSTPNRFLGLDGSSTLPQGSVYQGGGGWMKSNLS